MTHHYCGAITIGLLCPCEDCKDESKCGCREASRLELDYWRRKMIEQQVKDQRSWWQSLCDFFRGR